MQWHLLNQHYVNLDIINSEISVLEEVVSSEAQLVSVLVSGRISSETMNLVYPVRVVFNQREHIGAYL